MESRSAAWRHRDWAFDYGFVHGLIFGLTIEQGGFMLALGPMWVCVESYAPVKL